MLHTRHSLLRSARLQAQLVDMQGNPLGLATHPVVRGRLPAREINEHRWLYLEGNLRWVNYFQLWNILVMCCIVGWFLWIWLVCFHLVYNSEAKPPDQTKPNLLTVANTDLARKTVLVTEAFKDLEAQLLAPFLVSWCRSTSPGPASWDRDQAPWAWKTNSP